MLRQSPDYPSGDGTKSVAPAYVTRRIPFFPFAGEEALVDSAVDEALKDFVARRKHELPDAWF